MALHNPKGGQTVAVTGPSKQPFVRSWSPAFNEPQLLNSQIVPQYALQVGAADDSYEREADAVADAVVGGGAFDDNVSGAALGVQRSCASCENDEELRRSRHDGAASTPKLSRDMNARISRARADSGEALPTPARSYFESRFHADFSDVRVHRDAEAISLSKNLGARAFTVGSDIFFGAGQLNYGSHHGRHLVAHELTHTLQQGAASFRHDLSIPQPGSQEAPVSTPGSPDGQSVHGPGYFPARKVADTIQQCQEPKARLQRKVDFEFDLNYGMETAPTPSPHPEHRVPEGKSPLTSHDQDTDGFKVVADGPRIEITTDRFGLGAKGEAKMERAITNILGFTQGLEDACSVSRPVPIIDENTSEVDERFEKGIPTRLPSFKKDFHALPLGKEGSYYRRTCRVDGAPQATLDVPLESIAGLVNTIEKTKDKAPGKSLTGPDDKRAGVRSDALFHARDKVVAERKRQIKVAPTLSDGTPVSASNFSVRLEGFMIMVVSYLRTSEEKTDPRDYEVFAKAYPPIVLHTRFRQLFSDVLGKPERDVFNQLYGDPSVRANLYGLASRARSVDDSTLLFPAATKSWMEDWHFGPDNAPTWGQFIDNIVNNIPLRSTSNNEVMFTPLAGFGDKPEKAGPSRARIGAKLELRRIGWTWVPPARWPGLMREVMQITRDIND